MIPEIYFSLDVETDGPIPGPNSMLSLGCVAFDSAGKELSHFWANLQPLENAAGDPATMAWWATQPVAFRAATVEQHPPKGTMERFVQWVCAFDGKPVALAYPAGFDWTWVYWYLIKFAGRSPFGFQCLDMKSYACAVLGTPFRKTFKKSMPREWFVGLPPHTHLAVEDAREQGLLFFRMREANEHLPARR